MPVSRANDRHQVAVAIDLDVQDAEAGCLAVEGDALDGAGQVFGVGRCVKGRQNKDIMSFTLSIYSHPFLINEFHIDQLIAVS